ncbi:hypothetical protein [Piscinibacter koreensis]|uniref:Uncharacterized protein n=1 Tax=Piscinibacter koreensis TaxID=2742824 RepID=A0A7Y6NQR7_9BURK|nr:hypothetical protein [Schlegelella koreensis]NUZ07606.1 hypothetical protein [Schlegelella koreensis]
MADDAVVLELAREIQRLAARVRELEAANVEPVVRPRDRAALSVLLPALEASAGGAFTSSEALQIARRHPDVAAALGSAEAATAPRLAKLLARTQGARIGGLRLVRGERANVGVLWEVRPV